jgi:MFS family permease
MIARAPSTPARGARFFAAFAHRSFRLWFAGQIVSLVGTWMSNMAQGWLVYQLTGSSLLLGMVGMCGSLPMLLFTLWGGVLADRFPKRRILIVTQVMLMLLAFLLAALAAGPWIRFWHVLVVATLGGVVMAFDMPARQAIIIELVGEEDLMNAVALNSSVFNAARIVGPMVAGALLPVIQAAGCFLLNGVSFLAVLAGLLLMRHEERERATSAVPLWRHAAEAFRYVRTRPALTLLFVQLAFLGIFGWTYTVLMPVFADRVLRVGEHGFGLLMAANGAGALAASLSMATVRNEPRQQRVFIGMALFAVAQFLFTTTRFLPLAMLTLAVAGWAMIVFFTTANTLVQATTPDALRGRVMGIYSLTFTGTSPLGSLQAGWLAHHFGAPVAVRVGATVCLLTALFSLALLPRIGDPDTRRSKPV